MIGNRFKQLYEKGNFHHCYNPNHRIKSPDPRAVMAPTTVQLLQGYLLPCVFIIASILCKFPVINLNSLSLMRIIHCVVFSPVLTARPSPDSNRPHFAKTTFLKFRRLS
jgi:hypothetical protein